jgi:acyl-CoA thioesterase
MVRLEYDHCQLPMISEQQTRLCQRRTENESNHVVRSAKMGGMTSPWTDLYLERVASSTPNLQSFSGSISDAWRIAALPIGGFPLAIAVEAMKSTLGDDAQRIRTATAMFAAPVAVGPIEVDVTVLRRGRSVSQLTATVRNVGKDSGLTAVAAFGADRRGFAFTEIALPDVPAVELCKSWEEAKPDDFVSTWPPAPYWTDTCESKLAVGRWDHEPFVKGPAEESMWFRFTDQPTTLNGFLHPAVIAVMADSMPGAIGSKVDDPNWFAPSVDLTIHYFGDLTPGWTLSHARCVWAGDGYASATVDLWDPRTGVLAARATQVMLFTFPQ